MPRTLQATELPYGDRQDLYVDDIVAFLEEQFWIDDPDTGEPILLPLYTFQERVLRALFSRDERGAWPSEVVYSTIKKSGKTTIGAGICEWVACAHCPPSGEVIVAANDLEQAQGRVYKDLKHSIELNPLMTGAEIGVKTIKLSTGVEINAISKEYASISGSRHAAAAFDELWAYTSKDSKRFYDELTPIPTLSFSIRLVTSYAGFEGEGELMEKLVKRGMDGRRLLADLPVWRNGGLAVYYDSGVEARRLPWQLGPLGAAYYAEQARSLPANQFLRFHENRFTGREDQLFSEKQWDSVTDHLHGSLAPTKKIAVSVAVDIGTKHDSSGVVGAYRASDGRVALAFAKKFIPEPGNSTIGDVEAYLEQLHKDYKLATVRFDPSQFVGSAERLRKEKRLPMEEFTQTSDHLTQMGENLVELVKSRRLRVFADTDMRRHALNAVAIETPRGWKIAKEKASAKVDLLVALAMAALHVTSKPAGKISLKNAQVVRAKLRPQMVF